MISYLEGKIIFKKEKFSIVNVNGIGYEIFLSKNNFLKLPDIGENIKLFCYLDIGERSLRLYGFFSFEELEFFKFIRDIPGVGPKSALEISGLGPIEEIKKEIEKGNEKILDKIPGIGKKKAQKVILELSGKIKNLETFKKDKNDLKEEETFLALINLGFSKEKIKKVLSQLPKEIKTPQEKIKKALEIFNEGNY